MTFRQSFFASLIFLFAACNPSTDDNSDKSNDEHDTQKSFVQGISLQGEELTTEVDSASQREQIQKIESATEAYEVNQTLENLIWKGRQEAYLGRYDLAIETFTKAIKDFPEAYEPYRHRGHRYITIRIFDHAISDFNKAAELMEGDPIQIEKDGMPNKQNIPLSNIQFNVWYHLGLAHYLEGNWEEALEAYKKCLEVSDNTDLQVATMDWYYMTLIKLGRDAEAKKLIAPVTAELDIIENESYRKRILMYKGELQPDDLVAGSSDGDERLNYVTQGYGVGNHYLAQGDTVRAKEVFQKVIDTQYWAAFGYIASEMELVKLEDE